MKKVAIVCFPGSNCDKDLVQYVNDHQGYSAHWLWHENLFNIKDYEYCILPGGFSYGDYLRSGALAKVSPIMNSVKELAHYGKPVLGICNGFQILCETELLPGALVKNYSGKFIDDWSVLSCENKNQYFGPNELKEQYSIPIAHGDGRYYAPAETLNLLLDNEQIWFTYQFNPNGSLLNIAGVMNKEKNVCGLMPHPERAYKNWMGSSDGWSFL